MKIKLTILSILYFSISFFAQDKNAIKAKELFWGSNDSYKNKTIVPEKWKNESAVVIYKNINYSYRTFGKKITYISSIRKRIKLQDKNAVEEFSKFNFSKQFRSSKGDYYFTRKKGKTYFGVKIIKPDGKEIEIDTEKEAIKNEDSNDNQYKIAISNLEVGDIIDYYYYTIEPFKVINTHSFESIERPISDVYPIMDFKLTLDTENNFFINFKSLNGAPELKQIPSDKKSIRKYEFRMENIDKNDYPIWFYPLLELPSIKLQVFFSRHSKTANKEISFLPENEKIIKSKIDKQEFLDLYNRRLSSKGNVGDIKSFLKGKVFKSNEEKVIASYYYIRHYYLTRFLEAYYADKTNIFPTAYYLYGYPVIIQSQKHFVKHFTQFLKRNKIPYEVVASTKRYNGSIDDLIIENNVDVLIKVKTKNPLYATFFAPHTTISYFSPLLENSEAYFLSRSEKQNYKLDQIRKDKLPLSKYTDNESTKVIDLTIHDDFGGFDINIETKLKGHSKVNEQYNRFIFSDYVYKDYKRYNTKSLVELIKKKKEKERVSKEFKALITKLKKNQKEYFEEQAKSELDIETIEDYEYKITHNGRFKPSSYFTYTESYNFDNHFIKKAGPNYIIEIGKFIGGQIEVEEKYRKRDANIYMSYPRMFNNEISLNIPEGFTVAGLDKLNKNISNEAGAFMSSAKVEGNKLIIQTSKQYKGNFFKKDQWPNILSFLDEANQFTNEKILLKKI